MPSSLQRIVSKALSRIAIPIPPPPITRAKRALLIGINYVDTPYELKGCIHDVETMDAYYRSIGITDIRTLTDYTDPKPTREAILESFEWLKQVDGDLFLHFSGHGNLEHRLVDPTDCLLVTLTSRIRDDEIRAMFETLPSTTSLFCCFDVCHNGSGLDLRYQVTGNSMETLKMAEDDRYPLTESRIVLFSGCGDSQTCAEAVEDGRLQGVMTWALREALKKSTILQDLLIHTTRTLEDAGYTQRPIISLGRSVDLTDKAF